MMLAGVPIQGILFTVFQSIFQVFLLCLAGFVLSFKGIVDKPTSKTINHLNIALFTPALLFSKVAYFLSPAKLRQLWVIPIFFTIVTGLSAVIAHWLARAFRLKRSQVNFATAASMFMNSNSLPVALMQSLATTVPLLRWGPDDTVDAMFGRSLTYLVVFSTLGMILRWSYGIRLLSQVDEPETHTPVPPTYRDNDGTDERPALASTTVDLPATTRLVDYETEPDVDPPDQNLWHTRLLRSRLPHPHHTPLSRRHTHPHIYPYSHLPAVPTALCDQSESDESDELGTTEGESEDTIVLQSEAVDTGFSTEAEDPARALQSTSSPEAIAHSVPRWDRHTRPSSPSLCTRLFNILTSLSPPLIASLLSIFVVLVPPLQRLLKSAEMIPFKGALDNAGACSVPLTLIVLGGWFWDGEPKPTTKSGHVRAGEVKGRSDGQAKAKNKGKGIKERHGHDSAIPTLLGEGHDHPLASTTELAVAHLGHHDDSRNSSTGSLSSIIGAFGDVVMARVYPRGSSGRAEWRVRGNVVPSEGDVEQGRSATHTEAENEHANSGPGRSSRSRSRTDPVNGHARQSPVSATPKSPHARETNPPGETLTIVLTLLARMIIVPLIVTPMMVLVSRLGWGGQVIEDPVFIVSSMLLIASPPALTLAQISQRAKAATGADPDAFSPFERLLSRTVFWAYLVLTPPMTIASVMVGLLLIGA